jgi:transposase
MSSTHIATIGIDLGKNVFHVVGLDATGEIALRKKRSRNQLEQSLANISPCLIGMEACAGVREVKVASEPETLLAVLNNPAYLFKRIGLEAGPMSQWLYSALAEAELPVICVETRHMRLIADQQDGP